MEEVSYRKHLMEFRVEFNMNFVENSYEFNGKEYTEEYVYYDDLKIEKVSIQELSPPGEYIEKITEWDEASLYDFMYDYANYNIEEPLDVGDKNIFDIILQVWARVDKEGNIKIAENYDAAEHIEIEGE